MTVDQLRPAVIDRDGPALACWLCGKPIDQYARGAFGLALDHVVPRSMGGRDELENIEPAHQRCNTSRGNRPPRSLPM